MTVSVNQVQRQPKQDPLDLIIKGLNIAGSVYGIKEAQAKIDQIDRANAESEAKKSGVASPMERAALLDKGFTVSDENTPGAQRFIASEDQKPVYLLAPKAKSELRTPGTKDYFDPKTGKNKIAIIGQNGPVASPTDLLAPKPEKEPKDLSIGQADDLRNYHDKHEITKTTNQLSQSYNKMQAAAAEPSAAGDMKMIYNFMKMQDPGSTVREGEYASAQNARGVPDTVLNAYNSILNGTRLTEEQRADFLKQAGDDWNTQRENQMALDKKILAIAKKRGLDPEDVLLNVYDLQTAAGPRSKTLNQQLSENPPSQADVLAEINKRAKKGTIKLDIRSPEQQAAWLKQLNQNASKVGQQ